MFGHGNDTKQAIMQDLYSNLCTKFLRSFGIGNKLKDGNRTKIRHNGMQVLLLEFHIMH